MKSEIVTQNPAIGIECVLRFYVRPAGTSSGDALLNYFGPARCLLPFLYLLPVISARGPAGRSPEGVSRCLRCRTLGHRVLSSSAPSFFPIFRNATILSPSPAKRRAFFSIALLIRIVSQRTPAAGVDDDFPPRKSRAWHKIIRLNRGEMKSLIRKVD